MIVRDIMSPGVTTVTQDDTAFKAATLMKNHNIGAIPVMCGKKVCGMVTDRDIVLRCIASGKDANECKICEVMTGSAVTVTPDRQVSDAASIMASEQLRRLPVVENGELTGIVSLSDIARQRQSTEVSKALCEISMP